MPIWGRGGGEPPAGESDETGPPAEPEEAQAPAGPEDKAGAEPRAGAPDGEPAPAFWRAQGEAPAPAATGFPAGNVADPLLADDIVVLDGQSDAEPAPAPAADPPSAPVAEPVPGPAAVPGPAPVVAVPAAASPDEVSAQRWTEILMSFVDDPGGSVTTAAAMVDSAIDELVDAVRARQRAMASSWRGSETDTETLRVTLRDYRTFWHEVQRMTPAADGTA